MKTRARHLFAAALTALMLSWATGAEGQSTTATYYVVESGGATTGNCPVTAPCTFDRALTAAAAGTEAEPVVAIQVRRTGDRAVISRTAAYPDGKRYFLAVYNETEGSVANRYLVEGSVELRGQLTLSATGVTAALAYYPYDSAASKLNLNVSGVVLGDYAFSAPPDSIPDFRSVSQISGRVVFQNDVTITNRGGSGVECGIFENLEVPAGVTVTVEGGTCTSALGSNFATMGIATDDAAVLGIYVWNTLDVDGTLELEDNLSLHLIAMRPRTKRDSAYVGTSRSTWPRAEINGRINATGTGGLYIQVEHELLYDTTAVYREAKSDKEGYDHVVAGDVLHIVVPTYHGWQNEYQHAYRISGSGYINANIYKTTQAGVRLDVPFGRGLISENRAGVLWYGANRIDGHFVNSGFAQTEFMVPVTITRDLQVSGPEIPAVPEPDDRLGIGSANATGPARGNVAGPALPGTVLECFDHSDRLQGTSLQAYWPKDDTDLLGYLNRTAYPITLGSRGLTSGVYFRRSGNQVNGALFLQGHYGREGDFRVPADLEDEVTGEIACYGGAYVYGKTDVMYNVTGDSQVHLYLDADLRVHGPSFDVATAEQVVVQSRYSADEDAESRSDGDLCLGSNGTAPTSLWGHLTFAGTEPIQTLSPPPVSTITIPGFGTFTFGGIRLAGAGLRVDKATDQEVRIVGSEVVAPIVDLRGGRLVTNGMLNMAGGHLLIHQSQGSTGDLISGPGAANPYLLVDADKGTYGTPVTLTYTGTLASMDTGDELFKGMSVAAFEMFLGTASSKLTLLTDINVTAGLLLSKGTLEIPTGISLKAPRYVEVGHATLEVSGGKWTSVEKGTIVFVGRQDRTTSNVLPAYSMADVEKAKSEIGVRVNGCRTGIDGKTVAKDGMTLRLQKGYTPITAGLTVSDYTKFDLAGNNLVANGEISVGANAWLCDSGGGVACSGDTGASYQELTALTEALADVHYADTPERRATLAQVQAAHASSGAAPTEPAVSGGQIQVKGLAILILEPNAERLKWRIPAIAVADKGTMALIRLPDAPAIPSTTNPPVPPDNIDVLSIAGLTLARGGKFSAGNAFDRYIVEGNLTIDSSTVSMGWAGFNPAETSYTPQSELVIDGDLTVVSAAELVIDGQVLTVTGDYMQGTDAGQAAATWIGEGTHYVMGDFYVGPDTDSIDAVTGDRINSNFYFLSDRSDEDGDGKLDSDGDHGNTCYADAAELWGYTVPTGLRVYGDYAFLGSGDAYDSEKLPADQLGLRGSVTFAGRNTMNVRHSGARNAFCHVRVATDPAADVGTVMMGSDVAQHTIATLSLQRGMIDSGAMGYAWSIANPAIEADLVGRLSIMPGDEGVISYGSRSSNFSGALRRSVTQGNQTGGEVKGGYLFPVGGSDSESGPGMYRPLILQFPSDLGQMLTATVDYLDHAVADSMEWPDEDLVVEGAEGMLTLDNVGPQFWRVMLDAPPAHDPNLRLAADGLANVFNIKGLRIVQWDCDGTNPRLAGIYDLYNADLDDKSMLINDFLNGVPNLTQEGVEVGTCSIFGIAANVLENPIGEDPITSGTASVQFIHNVVGLDVDVYANDVRIANDLQFQSARPFGILPAGTHTLDIVHAAAPDNSAPLLSQQVHFRPNGNYHVMAHGSVATGLVQVMINDGALTASAVEDQMSVYLVHGAGGLGMVDIRVLDPIDNTYAMDLWANNMSFGDAVPYISVEPDAYNLELTNSQDDSRIDVFRLEARSFADQAFVLSLSGPGGSSTEGLTMMGVGPDGDPFFPSVITSSASTELPTEFALLGNYPNPFNPSTRIAFDLPETAAVAVTVFDLLGRVVLALAPEKLEAGAGRTVDLNASSLASGNYFYRVVATGASGRHVENGRMMLIK